MNQINIKIIAGILSLFMGIGFIACEKDKNTGCDGGEPVITRVSPVTDREESLEKCDLSQYVIVQGRNFCDVDRIIINGIDADMDNAYVTPTEVTFQVPRKAPEAPTNQVVLYAGTRQASMDIVVDIPALIIDKMESEYVPVGENLVILGKNFDIWTKKVFMNETEVKVVKADINSLAIKIPEALVETTCKVKIVDVRDNEKPVPYYYRDDRNTPVTFSPYTGSWLDETPGGNGNGKIITDGTSPVPVSGAYCKVTDVSNGSWSWVMISNQVLILPDDAIINPDNYMLKWEYNNLAPYPNNMLQIQIGSQGGGQDGSILVDTKGKWKTCSMPVSKVITAPMGLNAEKKYAVTLAIVKSSGGGLAMDINFDNIRIVPKE